MARNKVFLIIASLVGVIMIAAGVVGALSVLNRAADTPSETIPDQTTELSDDPAKQEAQTLPDLSEDFGACTVITKDQVAAALSPTISSVPDFKNRGFGYLQGGDKAQTCLYDFSDGARLNDRLLITVTQFSEASHADDVQKGLKEDKATAVSGLSNTAYFATSSDNEELNETRYALHIFKDDKQYTFELIQPFDGNDFTVESARSALTRLAETV